MATESTYTLIPDPPTPGVGAGVAAKAPAGFPNFIGFGILTPFRRGGADFVSGGGLELLQSHIGQVLGTRAGSDFTEGEIPWRGDFGSLLHLLRHQNNNQVREELARIYVAEALARWVPQIRLKDVTITREFGPNQTKERNVLAIRIVYDVIGLRQAGNEVLVPNVGQNVLLAA